MKPFATLKLLLCGLAILSTGCGPSDDEPRRSESGSPRLIAFVSVLPQRYFLERIGGDSLEIHVMVGPGQSPATYEPTPRQMANLSDADFYFRIGVPFEDAWMKRIIEQNRRMTVIDTSQGIERRTMEAHHHAGAHVHDDDEAGAEGKDPHIWLDPSLVKIQARNIAEALQKADWQRAEFYQQNLMRFLADLERVDQEIHDILGDLESRSFMAFHPAWGYFADAYNLEQIPVEYEGKSPGAKTISRLIERARADNIDTIIVQEQFSTKAAEAVAEAGGMTVVTLDPLALNYLENLETIARAIAEGLAE